MAKTQNQADETAEKNEIVEKEQVVINENDIVSGEDIKENDVIIADGKSLPTPSEYVPYPTLREKSTENALGDLVRKIINLEGEN